MGRIVEGVEITKGHVGKSLKVTKTNENKWLPLGFQARIKSVGLYEIEFIDTSGDSYTIANTDSYFGFALGDDFKEIRKSTVMERKKLAKGVREAKKALVEAIEAAKEVGMVVELNGDVISYEPPKELY